MRKSIALLAAALAPLGLASAIATAVPQAAAGATATYSLTTMKLPNGTSVPLRWNGCQKAITWKVNLAAVPSAQRTTVLSETKTAVARIASYTGFTFSYKGYTTEVPTPGSMAKQTAELVVAYTSPTKTKYDLSGSILGQGGLYGAWVSRTVSGRTSYTAAALRGFVAIDTPQMLAQTTGGFGAGTKRTNLLMHELGHAFGLQHVSTTTQQMYPTLTTRSPNGLASGDRYGLYKAGKTSGCINTAYMPLVDLS